VSSASTRPQGRRGPTQTERVKTMMSNGWICGALFLSASPPVIRYTSRIHELRRDGYQIDRRPCRHPWHSHGPGVQMWEWKIVAQPDENAHLPGTSS
jgi:hypothetical protein